MSWGNRTVRRRAVGPIWAALIALSAGACASMPDSRQIFLPEPPKLTESAPQGQREHQRVLAAYGGAYEDPGDPAEQGQRDRSTLPRSMPSRCRPASSM